MTRPTDPLRNIGLATPSTSTRASLQADPNDIEQVNEHPVELRRILALFAPYRLRLTTVFLLIVATSVVGLATPFITKHIIDNAIVHPNVPLLLTLVGALIAIALVTQIFGLIQTYISTVIGQKIMHNLRTTLFEHLQRLPLSFFSRTRGGELQSRLTNDINGMQTVVTESATSIATNVTTAIGTIVAMIALSWRLSLLSLIVVPPSIMFARKVARMRRRYQTQSQQTLADMQTQIEESLSINGVMLSKTTGSGTWLIDRFTHTSQALTKVEIASQMAGRWRMATLAIIFATIPAFIYLVAGLPATNANMSIGTLVAFTALQATIFRPLIGVLNVGVQITTSMALFSRIYEYLDTPIDITDPTNPITVEPHTARGDLHLHGVTFRYPGSHRDALTDINLSAPGGTSVALVGATGSGKSTLASLISRLNDPTKGYVTIDGVELKKMTLDNVANLVGVVSQETYLLHTTIRENLTYAKPNATDDDIVSAAKAAQIHDLITTLPDGYDTIVGSQGHRFSGGEKQRIALARTMLRNPPILILDEATSALDNTTELAVQQALDAASKGRTTIAIAHRLSTIRNADVIVVLDDGHIAQQGTHEELLRTDGIYANLNTPDTPSQRCALRS